MRARKFQAAAAAAVAALLLGGCAGSGGSPAASAAPAAGGPVASSVAPAGSSSPASAPVSIDISPAADATKVRLDDVVTVAATGGRLTTVSVETAGATVAGDLSADGRTWSSSEPLAPGTTYTVTAQGATDAGAARSVTSRFSTLAPDTFGGVLVTPADGWTVGVGMPVVLNFTKTVKNRDAVVKALSVTSSPQVEGAWRWISSQQLQWRPKDYWKPGTTVKVTAALKGVEMAPGVWGKRVTTSSFTIGRATISTVDVAAHTLTVRQDGKVLRTIPVTTGKPGLATRNGVKVIISRESQHRMDAATTGVGQDSPDYYNIMVRYAMRLTWSGEFLHAAPWSVASQGRANVSHGCTGMSTADAKWLFGVSKVGDVVVYTNSKRPLEADNGWTAWNDSWKQWTSGSAAAGVTAA